MENSEWGTYSLESGIIYRAGHGPVSFLVRYRDGDWRISVLEGEDWDGPPTPADGEATVINEWSRRIVSPVSSADQGILAIYPELPNRPLVLRPPGPVIIPAGVQATLYVAIPVSVSVSSLEPKEFSLGLFPTQALSSTWMGNAAAGALAYTLLTNPHRRMDSSAAESWMATCTITINNLSPGEFNLDGMSLDTEILGIWAEGPRLITDKLVLNVRGEDQTIQKTVESIYPANSQDGARLKSPRREIHKKWSRQGLSTIGNGRKSK